MVELDENRKKGPAPVIAARASHPSMAPNADTQERP